MSSGYSDGIIEWMDVLVKERISRKLSLHSDTSGNVYLLSPTSQKKIIFETMSSTFTTLNPHIPFSIWDVSLDGLSGIIDNILPAPGLMSQEMPLTSLRQNNVFISYDILGLAYWMMSRSEEVDRRHLDKFGRFPASASHAFKNDYLVRPVVDEWLYILQLIVIREWPDIAIIKRCYKVTPSHDVDRPSKYDFTSLPRMIPKLFLDLMRYRDLKSFISILSHALLSHALKSTRNELYPDKYNTFDWIMNISEKYDLQSEFYFMIEPTVDPHDANYKITDKKILHLINKITSRGHFIGIHPSFNSFITNSIIRREIDIFKTIITKLNLKESDILSRMHYLRWSHPLTLRLLDSSGVQRDSTLGYADQIGFRCGTCIEYAAIDPISHKSLNLIISPLLIMDQTLLSRSYLNLSNLTDILPPIINLAKKCQLLGGNLTILWHNSELDNSFKKEVYENIIRVASSNRDLYESS